MSDFKYKKGLTMYPKDTENTIIEYVVLLEVYVGHGYYIGKYTKGHCAEVELMSYEGISKQYLKKQEEYAWENHPSIDKPSKLIKTEYDGFKEMTASFGKMLNEKNKRYGNAALDPLVIVGKHHRLGAKIDEKLSRIMNADELKKNDLADVIGYCFLICKDLGWTNFDDQLD